MKKLTTMLAAVALGATVASAAPVANPGVRTDLRITGVKPEYKSYFQKKALNAVQSAEGAEVITRAYVDKGDQIWEAKFQMEPDKLNEMFTFVGENGEPYQPSFDDLPYYVVDYTITRTKKGALAPDTYIIMYLEWPSMYIYDQVFSYDGELDADGGIPIAQRDYEPVSFEELFNNDKRCRRFQEDEGVGVAGTPKRDGKWDYYGMLPNEMLGVKCMYNGQPCFTMLNEQRQSSLEMKLLDPEELYMEFENNIYVDFNGNSRTVKADYAGTGEIEGLIPILKECEEFGDLHLFNTGLVSSDILQDENPYPGDFGEFTQFYYMIGNKHLVFEMDELNGNKVFDREKVHLRIAADANDQELREYGITIDGYAYGDAKFAKDQKLNPEEQSFSLIGYEEIGEGSDRMAYCVPKEDSLIPIGISDGNGVTEPWSEEYGTLFTYRQFPERLKQGSTIGWGWNEGFVLDVQNWFLATYKAYSQGNLVYHYNPLDMTETRELSLVGGRGNYVDSVKAIQSEDAKISAANGVITVVPAENGRVAVYGLDGVCLKNVKANAGETVSIEANKGIYVVTVNGASRKVAL